MEIARGQKQGPFGGIVVVAQFPRTSSTGRSFRPHGPDLPGRFRAVMPESTAPGCICQKPSFSFICAQMPITKLAASPTESISGPKHHKFSAKN